MADKSVQTYELKFEMLFVDGDTRTTTLKNPKQGITTNEIEALERLILNTTEGETLLIGDKTGSPFRRFNRVSRISTRTTDLDID